MSLTKSRLLAAALLIIALRAPRANAQLSIAIIFNSDVTGVILGAGGSPNATFALGSVQAYGGTVPSGVTKTVNGVSSWTLSTPIDIEVIGTGIIVPSFTLTAQAQSADPVNTWKVNSVILSSGALFTLTTTGTYNVNTPYTFSLTIPFSEPPGPINNTVNFTAIGN